MNSINSVTSLIIVAGCSIILSCSRKQMAVGQDVSSAGFQPTTYSEGRSGDFRGKYLISLPELDFNYNSPGSDRSDVMIITSDTKFASWRKLIYDNPSVNIFLVQPGNYLDKGIVRPHVAGKQNSRKMICYHDPKARTNVFDQDHPVQFDKGSDKEVLIQGFNFEKGINHWVLHGLTIRGNDNAKFGKTGGKSNLIVGCNDVIIDHCVIEGVLISNTVKISTCTAVGIQNNVIRDQVAGFQGDNIGVSITALFGHLARDVRVVNNEIYNVDDAVQLVRFTTKETGLPQTGEMPGTIIYNNDMYITKDQYVIEDGLEYACAEDGIDLKEGSTTGDPNDYVIIKKNRIWGYRKSHKSCAGSSQGNGIMIHRNAQNILIEENIIFDVSVGVNIAGLSNRFPKEKVEEIAVFNNVIYDIYHNGPSNGVGVLISSNPTVVGNSISNVYRPLAFNVNESSAIFTDNLILETDYDKIHYTSSLNVTNDRNAWIGMQKMGSAFTSEGTTNFQSKTFDIGNYQDLNFTIKMWTDPQRMTIPNILPKSRHSSNHSVSRGQYFQDKNWYKASQIHK